MSGNNWDQIQEIFFAAADLPASEREAFLARACKGDTGLRSEVDSLLRADSGGGSAIAAAISRAGREAILCEGRSPTTAGCRRPRGLQRCGRSGFPAPACAGELPA